MASWTLADPGSSAGAYVGFGGMLALSIGQNCPGLAESNPGLQKMVYGAFGLPVGLLMVRFGPVCLYAKLTQVCGCQSYHVGHRAYLECS